MYLILITIQLISTIIVSGANYVFTKKLMPELYFDYKLFNISYIWELLKNGVWNSVNKLSGILQTGLDLLLSNIFHIHLKFLNHDPLYILVMNFVLYMEIPRYRKI